MKKEEKSICDFMYNFTKKNWDKIDKERCELHKIGKETFLKEVSENVQTALWVLTEICNWGMYGEKFLEDIWVKQIDETDFHVIKIEDKYIKLKFNGLNYEVNFCSPKTKTVIYFD